MTAPPEPDHDEVPLHRNRDFAILWTGQAVSSIGSSMSSLVFPLLGYAVTGSAFLAGLAAAPVLGGELVGRLASGVLVDRVSKRRVIVLANAMAALAVASVAIVLLVATLSFAHLLAAGLVLGLADAFLGPAASSATRHVVPERQLPLAYARLQLRHHLASLVGPPLGGALFSVGRAVPMAVDAISYAAYGLLATRLRSAAADRADTSSGFVRDALEGFAFVVRHAVVRSILLWGGLFNFAMVYVFTAVTLRLVRAGVAPAAIGLVDTIAALAGILGAALAARIVARFRSGMLTIVTGLMLAVLVAPMGLTTNVAILGALFAIGMVLVPANNAGISAYMANATPRALQGRVNAAGGVFSIGLAPLGPPLAGVAVVALSGVGAMLGGAALLVLSIVPLVTNRRIVSLGRPDQWETVRA